MCMHVVCGVHVLTFAYVLDRLGEDRSVEVSGQMDVRNFKLSKANVKHLSAARFFRAQNSVLDATEIL